MMKIMKLEEACGEKDFDKKNGNFSVKKIFIE